MTAIRKFFDGRALWLGIKVGADTEMTPGQEIRPVPLACGLRPGASIDGSGFNKALGLIKFDNDGYGLQIATYRNKQPRHPGHRLSVLTVTAVWGSTSITDGWQLQEQQLAMEVMDYMHPQREPAAMRFMGLPTVLPAMV